MLEVLSISVNGKILFAKLMSGLTLQPKFVYNAFT